MEGFKNVVFTVNTGRLEISWEIHLPVAVALSASLQSFLHTFYPPGRNWHCGKNMFILNNIICEAGAGV